MKRLKVDVPRLWAVMTLVQSWFSSCVGGWLSHWLHLVAKILTVFVLQPVYDPVEDSLSVQSNVSSD